MKTLSMIIGLAILAGTACSGMEVQDSKYFFHDKSGLTVYQARVDLPDTGQWFLPISPTQGLAEVLMQPSEETYDLLRGTRNLQRRDRQDIREDSYKLSWLYHRVLEYAMEHEGKSPASLDHFENHWDVKREGIHYIPERLLLIDATNRNSRVESTELLAFELNPSIDDGKHWTVQCNGRTKRVDIDLALFERYKAKLERGGKTAQELLTDRPDQLTYLLYARQAGAVKPVTITVSNALRKTSMEITWDATTASPGESGLLEAWANNRMWQLPRAGTLSDGVVINHWMNQAHRLYHSDTAWISERSRNRRNRQTSAFGVLGGRAAIRETLQLQNLGNAVTGSNSQERVAIDTIQGVNVKSHDYEEMLAGQDGGRLALADLIPQDRFLAYFADPKSMLQFLDGGTRFMFHTGSSLSGHSLAYNLEFRYLERMGLNKKWLRALLSNGAVDEMAVMLPDLYLIEGTEMTVIARLKNPIFATAALKMVGIHNLSEQTVETNQAGESVCWAKRGDLLIISTHKNEMERVLSLHQAKGKGSLGRSAEFRYMLTQLPVKVATSMWVYFSDPFIRRLVGPATKIGQLRRLQARTELEGISAGALLYKKDGHRDNPTLEQLIEKGYVTAPQQAKDATLQADGLAVSPIWGRPARMHSLMDHSLEWASGTEAAQYKNYVDNYNRFWRRFFDPIAIRMDEPAVGSFDLSVFILPLVDNSVYQGLRSFMTTSESGRPLQTPVIEPAPVAMLSMNVQEEFWIDTSEDLVEVLEEMLGVDPSLLDYLGPDLHLALGDGDPIIGAGSGDLMGLFGSGFGVGGNDMAMIPVVLSMLTRPAGLLIGLQDPQAVVELLRNSASGNLRIGQMDDWMSGSLYKVSGKDEWIYSLNLVGMMNLRFGLEVEDRYLVIKNLPHSQALTVTQSQQATLNAAQLLLDPGACDLQMASLYASAVEKQREAALSGISHLYPLMATGMPSVDEAKFQHTALFGFAPVHPYPGSWQWDCRELTSSESGSYFQPQQPTYEDGNRDFGVMQGVKTLRLSMQFEQDGLRTTVHWEMMKGGKSEDFGNDRP